MILNFSDTPGCDQILKQMIYRGKKLKKRKSLKEEVSEKKEKKKYGGA